MPVDKRRWTTPEQLCWLVSCFPDYLEAQAKGRYDKFWPKFFTEWFETFPAREPNANDVTDSEPEPESEPDVPSDNDEEGFSVSSKSLKRKCAAAKNKAKKRQKKVGSPERIIWGVVTYVDHAGCPSHRAVDA